MASISVRLNSVLRRIIRMLPPALRLRTLTSLDVWQGSVEPENARVPHLMPADRREVALDVGANNGVTTQIMASVFKLVHAFEPNPRLAAELAICAPKNVSVHPYAVSSQSGSADLSIPISKGVLLSGWGSLSGNLFKDFERLQMFKVETRTIDSFQFERVDFIKIDVEGHEMSVLEGAMETIRRCRPWLVIEAIGDQPEAVRAFLRPFDYCETDLATLASVTGTAHNLIFLPR